MQQVLSHLEQSSADTVVAMNAAKGTMETMNQSLQRQLALYYEISVNVIYEPSSKELLISNNGRTNVTIWGDKFGDQTPLIVNNGRAIPPSGAIKTDATFVYDYMTKKFPKPTAGFIPYEIYIKNDKGEKFLQVSEIGIQWSGDVGTLMVQTTAVAPGQWKPGTAQNLIFTKVE